MATLTETAFYSRKVINFTLVILVGLVILRLVWIGGSAIFLRFFPPGPAPANYAFDKLPAPNAQNNSIKTVPKFNYILETIDGKLPATPKTVRAYLMPRPPVSFDSFNNMKNRAARIGFTSPPARLNNTLWRFNDPENPLRFLEMDEITLDFNLKYDYTSDLNLFQEKNFSLSDQDFPKTYLENLAILTPDLENGSQTTTFFKLESNELVVASSLSTADALSVTFNRENIDDLSIVNPDPRRGLVSVLLSASSDSSKRILEVRFFHPEVDLANPATYPTMPSEEAFEKLKSGKALYASIPKDETKDITIRSVYLAYLDPFPQQSYLQPVWVFYDEQEFVAYIPAVSPDWIVE